MAQVLSTSIKRPFWTHKRVIFTVVSLGFILRLWAAWQLPVDYDEPTYVDAGYQYAKLFQAGDINGIIDFTGVNEHPPLVKLVYGLTYLILGRGASWSQALYLSRFISLIFGSLAVYILALIDPLAGVLLAVQTLVVKYTSQAYLEAIPLFFSLLAMFLLKRSGNGRDKWFILSAFALGITGAGKYSYFPILLVILYILIWEKHQPIGNILLYLFLASIAFFAFDPYLWHYPIGRLVESLRFHLLYSQGTHVQEVNLPWYQPLIWISRSHGFIWHPNVFFYFGIDGIIFLSSLPGFWFEWKNKRWVTIWAIVGMLVLFIWNTKWPQYTLSVLPAFCLASSTAIQAGYRWLKEQELYWEWFHNMFPRPTRRYIIIGSVLFSLLVVGTLISQVLVAINRIGWTNISTVSSGLPSDKVNAILPLLDGRMLIGTDAGVAFWKAASNDEISDDWVVFNPGNSSLPDQHVYSLAKDMEGTYWIGTEAGLANFNGSTWNVFRAADIGLTSEQVNDIAIDQFDNIWIATLSGVAMYNGENWRSFTQANSGLGDNAVFAVAVNTYEEKHDIWFGTLKGVTMYHPESDEWLNYIQRDIDLGWGGVSDLLIDSRGNLWVSTKGGGISIWNGKEWEYIRVSNSDLPFSIVPTVEEVAPGDFWISAALPNSTGGVICKYDGSNWQIYREGFSGYSGAETLAIAKDKSGRYWFGTRTKGIDLFLPKH